MTNLQKKYQDCIKSKIIVDDNCAARGTFVILHEISGVNGDTHFYSARCTMTDANRVRKFMFQCQKT